MKNSSDIEIAERTLTGEIKLYYDLVLPSSGPAPLLIALHGYSANKKQMMREARSMAPTQFAVASLQGFHQHLKEPKEKDGPLRYGFGWLTNFHPEDSIALHHRTLLSLIDKLVVDGTVSRERVFLLGFSQSCALNYRFAFTHPDRLRGVIGICGGVPGDWDSREGYRQTETAVFHLSGEHDEFYPPARVADYPAKLRMRARNVDFKGYDAGHEIIQPMREDVRAWLVRTTG